MSIIHEGFASFKKGTPGNAGANLFVDATGAVRRIAEQDLNGDGYFDIVFPNTHGYIERGPTSIYTRKDGNWVSHDLPHDSCWRSRFVDIDGDGYEDLLIANGENGVSSVLTSYIYWGGKDGLTGQCSEFSTNGAYDAVAIDLTGNGLKDIIFTSAWYDHHYPGFEYQQKVFVQEAPRVFREATEEYNFHCNTVMSLIADDLTGNGYEDLVFVGYKKDGIDQGIGYIYYNGPEGLAKEPVIFDTWLATGAMAVDLFGTGQKDIITTGGNRVTIYRNRNGRFTRDDSVQFEMVGHRTQFFNGRLGLDVADIDGDGVLEMVIGTGSGIEIRKVNDLEHVWQKLLGFFCSGVKAYDFSKTGKMDLVACCYTTLKSYDTDSFIFHNVDGVYSFDNVTPLLTHGAVNVDVADLDHDGLPELYFCNTMAGPTQSDPAFPTFCYYGSRSLQYPPECRKEYPVKMGAHSYATADVDNDGYPELVMTSWDDIRIFKGTPDGPDPDNYYDIHDPKARIVGAGVLADLNGDGWLDIVMPSYVDMITPSPNITVFWGSESGYSDSNTTKLPCMVGVPNVVLADINGDGYLDLVYGDLEGKLWIYYGCKDGFTDDGIPVNIPYQGWNGAETMGLTVADINHDGKCEILLSTCGHYTRRKSYLVILFDPDNNYPLEKQVVFDAGGTTGYICMADLRKTGNLDLILPFYSTTETRVLPMRIFYNDGKGNFDFDNPLKIQCESSIASMAIDLNRNGYPDLLVCCHRNDLGHTVDSLLFSNGPDGLDLEHPQKLLGYGPHDFTKNVIFNMMDRSESEYYTSAVIDLAEPLHQICWTAETPNDTKLNMRVRFAQSAEKLEEASWSEPLTNGQDLCIPEGAAVMQYQAEFFAPNACGTPRLTRVELH